MPLLRRPVTILGEAVDIQPNWSGSSYDGKVLVGLAGKAFQRWLPQYDAVECVWRRNMRRSFTAVWQEGNWYVAQRLEMDVASQGESEEGARKNLQEALALGMHEVEVEER